MVRRQLEYEHPHVKRAMKIAKDYHTAMKKRS